LKIIRADSAGFCFGVRRAYDLASKKRNGKVSTLGELIHNPEVLEELNSQGVRAISAISRIREGVVIIRAHGISKKKLKQLKQKKVEIVDASCPFVKKIQAEVEQFVKRGIPVLILGRRSHPEMRAVIEDFPEVEVLSRVSEKQLKKFAGQKVGVLAQTTESSEKFEQLVKILKKLKVKVIPRQTICGATNERQKATVSLARKVDLMVVVGGKKSNNTKQLFALVKGVVLSHWVESEGDLQKTWFAGVKKVGISAGASTPENTISRVCEKLKSL
jgi:small subunit ribosomal protein S1